jgi:hypothetical protein
LKEEVLNFQIPQLERSTSADAAASVESKMATMQHKIFFLRS